MGKIKLAKINNATPGDPMNNDEFVQMIKKAEQGPFYSVNQVKAEFAKWKAKYSK